MTRNLVVHFPEHGKCTVTIAYDAERPAPPLRAGLASLALPHPEHVLALVRAVQRPRSAPQRVPTAASWRLRHRRRPLA